MKSVRWNGLVEAGAEASAAPFPVGTRVGVGTGMTVRGEMLAGDDDDSDDDDSDEEKERGVPTCRFRKYVKKNVKNVESLKK